MTPRERSAATARPATTGRATADMSPSTPGAEVADVDALTDPRWARLVTSRPTTVFHSPPWLQVLADTYGFPVRARLLTDRDGAAVAGLAYTPIADGLDPRIVSLPFSDFCDPVVSGDEQWRQLIDGLLARGLRIDLRCLHSDVPVTDPRFVTVDRALWHAVDVGPGEDEMWRALPGSARRALRRAAASGVTVHAGRDESDMRAFFELHLRVRKYKYGLLAQPYRFFAHIWDRFIAPGHGVLLLASIAGQVVSGVVFLRWQDTLFYKFNASDPAHLGARPNDRVLWEGIAYARDQGLRRIDLGLTDAEQEGLVRYKRKYATAERPITLLRHLPAGLPSGRDQQVRALLRDITGLLTDPAVPDDVSERAGDAVYRYFA